MKVGLKRWMSDIGIPPKILHQSRPDSPHLHLFACLPCPPRTTTLKTGSQLWQIIPHDSFPLGTHNKQSTLHIWTFHIRFCGGIHFSPTFSDPLLNLHLNLPTKDNIVERPVNWNWKPDWKTLKMNPSGRYGSWVCTLPSFRFSKMRFVEMKCWILSKGQKSSELNVHS